MPYQTPTLNELVERTARAFRANLRGSDAWLYPNNVADSAKVIGGAVWEPFSFLRWIWQQQFAHLCDGDMLDRHGAELGMPRLPPARAQGAVTLTGTNSLTVPAGLELKRADGLRYTTTSGGTITGGSVTVQAEASAEGKVYNMTPGSFLTLTAQITGVDPAAMVASAGMGGGADLESHENYRSRILFRKRFVPHGGAAHDYVTWAREINGVTRVYVDPVTASNGRQTVGVWFLMDDTYADGIPQAADVAIVAAYIDGKRPAGAKVEVSAPVALPQTITISALSPDTASVRSAVIAELQALFRREMHVSTVSEPRSVYRSKLWEAVSIAAGEDHHQLTLPATDIVMPPGTIATLGAINFV